MRRSVVVAALINASLKPSKSVDAALRTIDAVRLCVTIAKIMRNVITASKRFFIYIHNNKRIPARTSVIELFYVVLSCYGKFTHNSVVH